MSKFNFPYISRKPAEDIENALSQGLETPNASPVAFHVWGVGGVGKTTLRGKLKEDYTNKADFTEISFGETQNIANPIEILHTFYENLPPIPLLQKDIINKDPFKELY
jgi:signal recognition particle GTPase